MSDRAIAVRLGLTDKTGAKAALRLGSEPEWGLMMLRLLNYPDLLEER